ncbi:ABC transporter ATP-binding protein [Streptomyces fractus]|uniref:ABC transporter ATP-binding protein n=1 Tax=Streptomyces fractus TaxID=641806 RepID=UPI003CEA59C8
MDDRQPDDISGDARTDGQSDGRADGRLALRAHGITKYFGNVVALDGVDLDVAPGRIHGLAGPNGAGKTTLLGLFLGLAVPDTGSLEVLGAPVGRALAAPAGVAGFVDGPGLYPTLSARQNLRALAELRGLDARTAPIGDALDEVGLGEVADDRVRGFSLGMRQRLGLAAALLTEPRLLILDEPSNGLDPAGTRHVHRVLHRLAAAGTAVVLSSHRMDDLEALCSEVTILATGRVVFSGPLSELAAEHRELEYRLLTSDPRAARELAAATEGIRTVEASDAAARYGAEALVVRARVPAVDALVARIVGAGVALRELAPVVSPLEAAFLALTERTAEDRTQDLQEGGSGNDEADEDAAGPPGPVGDESHQHDATPSREPQRQEAA